MEDILGDFKFEVASPYILYRSKSDEVLQLLNAQIANLDSYTQNQQMETCRLLEFGFMMRMRVQWYLVYCSE